MSGRGWGTRILKLVTLLGFVYLFVPIVMIGAFSFNHVGEHGNNIGWKGFTLDNWGRAFKGSQFTSAMWQSLKVAAVACTLATILGSLVAVALSRYRMRGGAFINMMLVLPLTTPEIVMGASLFTLFFKPTPLFGNFNWHLGTTTVVIAHTMFCLSFVALTVKARLRGLDWTLEDAAADLGSTPLRTFRKITLPMISPGIAAAFLLSVALSIDDYIITSFVAGDAMTKTFPRAVFDTAKRRVEPQIHVIATMVMTLAIVIIVTGTVLGNRRRAKLG